MNPFVKIRRDLHLIPELGFQEYKTQAYLLSYIENLSQERLSIKKWKTGLFVKVHGLNPRKTIGYRADIDGLPIEILNKKKGSIRYWIGGTLFGLGWALVGSCPGPIFILIGAGFMSVGVILVGALLGTFLYGVLKDRLPH